MMNLVRSRTTKVKYKAVGMSRICVDRLTYRQSKMSKDGNKGLLNLTDIFCLQLYIKITLAFLKILTDRQRYLFLEAPFP